MCQPVFDYCSSPPTYITHILMVYSPHPDPAPPGPICFFTKQYDLKTCVDVDVPENKVFELWNCRYFDIGNPCFGSLRVLRYIGDV